VCDHVVIALLALTLSEPVEYLGCHLSTALGVFYVSGICLVGLLLEPLLHLEFELPEALLFCVDII